MHVLGPVELITDSGTSVRVPTRKRRVMLSLLALEANRVVPLDRLVDVLWEGCPPEHARTVVHGHISALRQLLGPGMAIETRPPGYVLAVDADRVDAHRFAHLVEAAAERAEDAEAVGLLREALGLWRGQALTDLAGASPWHDLATPGRTRVWTHGRHWPSGYAVSGGRRKPWRACGRRSACTPCAKVWQRS